MLERTPAMGPLALPAAIEYRCGSQEIPLVEPEKPATPPSSARNPLDDERPEGLREMFTTWGPALLAVVLIRLFIFEPFRIPSGSMVPTLLIGDQVIVTKFSYGVWMPFKSIGLPFTGYGLDDLGLDLDNVELLDLGDPERGDVIVFHYPNDEDTTYIKRVVGLPGDRIKIVDNQIVLNGVPEPRVPLGRFDDVDDGCQVRPARRWAESLTRASGGPLRHAILTNIDQPSQLANKPEITVPPGSVFAMGDNRDHSADGRAWGFVSEALIKGKAHAVWFSWNGCDGKIGSVRLDRMMHSLYSTDGLEAPPDAAPAP